MADNDGAPVVPPTTPDPAAAGADPTKTESAAGAGIDTSKLTDDDFAKLFTDERLYKHPKFADLRDKAKLAKQYETEKAENEKKILAEQGKFKELADQAQKEKEVSETKFKTLLIDNAIMSEAVKKGIKDPDAAAKLIDRSAIQIDENGQVVGLTEAMDALVKDKSYLLTINRSQTGSPTNPDTSNNPAKFKMSQLADSKFYQENFDAIQKALAAGEIEDDR